jgi:hypothetical protein
MTDTMVVNEFSALAESSPKVAETLQVVESLTVQLVPLREKAKTIEVKFPDRESYQAIGGVLTEVRALRKQGEAHMSPFEVLVSRVQTFLRTARQKHTNACEEIEGIIRPKMKAWEQAELAATQAEQKKLEKKAEKTGQQAPTVQHNIPATAGYRRSTVYRVAFDTPEATEKFLRAYRRDPKDLEKYVMIDIQAMQKDLREEIKDVKEAMKRWPGSRCWTE